MEEKNEIEIRFEEIKKRLEELPLEANTERLLLLSEAIQLERILQARKIANIEILDFFLREGLITIEEKEKIKIKWDSIKPGKIGYEIK